MREGAVNAYWFDYGKEVRIAVYEDFSVSAGHWEYYVPCGLIFAETRGKAKVMFCREHDFEFITPVRTRLIARNVDRAAGIADYDDPLWANVDPKYFERW